MQSLGLASLEAQSPFLYKPCFFITHLVCGIVLHQQQKVERNKKKLLKVLKSGKQDLVYNQMVLTYSPGDKERWGQSLRVLRLFCARSQREAVPVQ